MARDQKILRFLLSVLIYFAPVFLEAKYKSSLGELYIPQNTTYSHASMCEGVRPWPNSTQNIYTPLTQKVAQEREILCQDLKKIATDEDHPYNQIAFTQWPRFCTLTQREELQIKSQVQDLTSKKNKKWLLTYFAEPFWYTGNPEEKTESDLEEVLSMIQDRSFKEDLLQKILIHQNYGNKLKIFAKELLVNVAPRHKSKGHLLKFEDMISASQDALAHNEPDLALHFLKLKREIGDVEKRRKWFEQKRHALRLKNDKPALLLLYKAIWNFEKANYKKSEPSLHFTNSTTQYARALWTNHQTLEALRILDRTQKILKSSEQNKDLNYLKARIREEQKNINEAISLLEGTRDASYLWNLAWIEFKNEFTEKSLQTFDILLDLEDQDQGRRSQALYWKARAHAKLNQKSEAEKAYSQILAEDPNGYYAFLTAKDLSKKISTLKDLAPSKPYPPTGFELKTFHCITQSEDWEMATSMLLEEIPLNEKNLKNAVDYLPLYAEARAYGLVLSKVSMMPGKEKQALLLKSLNFLYPILYTDAVLRESKNHGLQPEYLWAIMRQESNFNPLARSPTGALGLMQVMPLVTQSYIKNLPPVQKGVLVTQEDLNISIGADHLKTYLDKFKNNFVLATAAYNASPEAVRSWMRSRTHSDPTLFIEDIPYEETRNYVKLVLRNYINYSRRIHSNDEMDFPSWLLEPLK